MRSEAGRSNQWVGEGADLWEYWSIVNVYINSSQTSPALQSEGRDGLEDDLDQFLGNEGHCSGGGAGGRAAIWFPGSGPHPLHAVVPAAGPRSDDEGKVTYDPLQQTRAARALSRCVSAA